MMVQYVVVIGRYCCGSVVMVMVKMMVVEDGLQVQPRIAGSFYHFGGHEWKAQRSSKKHADITRMHFELSASTW
jgi:hypothetical protein